MRVYGVEIHSKQSTNIQNLKNEKNSIVEEKKSDCGSQINYNRNYPRPAISFRGIFEIPSYLSQVEYDTEMELSTEARKLGINTPEITNDKYFIKGQCADPINNAITNQQLNKVFNYMATLDNNGILHCDLDPGHVFYSGDSNVELDCFRYANRFQINKEESGGFAPKPILTGTDIQKPIDFPSFMMPANLINYEEAALGHYLSGMKSENLKDRFIEQYLKESSEYHQKRYEHLLNNGFGQSNIEVLDTERIQAELLKKPTSAMVDVRKDRIEFLAKKREAFTEWDESNGACGHEFSPEGRMKSIVSYFDCMDIITNCIANLQTLENDNNGDTSKYFENEKKFAEFWLDNLKRWNKGMASYNFEDARVIGTSDYGAAAEIKAAYDKLIKTDSSNIEELKKSINKCRGTYMKLAHQHGFLEEYSE